MKDFKFLENKLLCFLDKYLKQSGASGFSIGVSGGLDSAIVATLCSKVAKTHALLMPTNSSNNLNLEDGLILCEKLDLEYEVINIEPILQSFISVLDTTNKLRKANIIARVRMILLYDNSAKLGTLVVGTSNKSERLLGYGTIYGDTACALNPIGDIYKSDLFLFAKYLEIDENIINKAPSADLWEGQKDEDEIGFAYSIVDAVLKEFEKTSQRENLYAIFDRNLVDSVLNRVEKNSFKLNPVPIANIS
ncbi:NAD+ synthase [Campylobacter fetus]|uniref:NAD+ synthase n=1 Tax=Campylobacter fetus TaxID=196 RepID=UPI00138DEE3A|nr:NAD+ synthase [Campylobacter fetus]